MRMIPLPSACVLVLLAAAADAATASGHREVVDRNGNVISVREGRDRADRPPVKGASGTGTPPVVAVAVAEPVAVVRTAEEQQRIAAGVGGSDTWPMYQANARHTGFLPIDLDPSRFAFRWQRDIGGNFALNPVAAGDGKVFVSLDLWFNNVVGFYALDADDGHTVWSKSLGPVSSVNPPSYAYGMAYIQSGKESSQGIPPWIRAYDGDTGALVFQEPFTAQWESYLAPTVHDGKVYVNGGYYGGMYAFDAFSGSQLWFVNTLPQYDMWTPAVDDTRAYAFLGEYTPGLYVRNRASGSPAGFIDDPNFNWNGWSMNVAPVLGTGGNVIAAHNGRLICFDTATNSIRWELPAQYSGQPSLAGGRIYAVRSGLLQVVEEMTGVPSWFWPAPDGPIVPPMIVTQTHVLVSTAQSVHAVDLVTRQSVWTYPIGGHLAMAGDTLYVASSDGRLTAITAPAGRLAAQGMAVDGIATPSSDGNGLIEPGETAGVAPSWLNGSLAALAFTGEVTSFSGPGAPGNPTYTIQDATAAYPLVPAGAPGSCAATGDCYALGVSHPSTRPGTHWDASFDEEISPASLGTAKTWTLHLGDSFADVPRSSPYYRFVETVLHGNVTGGCTGTAYCPAAPVSREQMAVFVLVSKHGSGYAPAACGTPMFADVPATSPFCRWIEELARRGVAGGCGAGLYCPTAPVSRQEMAVFVLATKEPGFFPPACATPMFSDVPAASPFCRWIEELARRGVVSGCGGGAYCPESPVTREQMSVFLAVSFGMQLYGP